MTRHPIRMRLLTVPLAAAGLVVFTALTSWAHVEVQAIPARAGATNVTLTFRVPNEEAPAVTNRVTVVMPSDHPLVGVTASSQNGFRPTMTTRHLDAAVPGKNGPVSDVVTQVVFSGGTIAGTDERPFVLHVDKLPAGVRTLTFKVLQRYDNSTTVSWIEVAADGAAEPEHPAPVLTLAGPATSASEAATVAAVAAAPPGSASPGKGGLPVAPLGWAVCAIGLVTVVLVRRRRRSERGS